MRQAGFHSFHSLPVTLNSELDSEKTASTHKSLSLFKQRHWERYWRLVSRRLSLTLEWLLIFLLFFYRQRNLFIFSLLSIQGVIA